MGFEFFRGYSGKKSEKHGDAPDQSRRKFLSGKSQGTDESQQRMQPVATSPESDVSEEINKEDKSTPGMSRRKFIQMMAMFPLGAVPTLFQSRQEIAEGLDTAVDVKNGILNGNLSEYIAERKRENEFRETFEERVTLLKNFFQQRYCISLIFEENPHFKRRVYMISDEAHLSSKIEAVSVLLTEFNLYPFFVIRGLCIPSICIRGSMQIYQEGKMSDVDGFAVSTDDHTLALNVNDTLLTSLKMQGDFKSRSLQALRMAIHHELYHLSDPCLDMREDDTVNEVREQKKVEWLALNRNDHVYKSMESQDRVVDCKGFASPYGMTSLIEDRATVWQGIMSGQFSEDFLEEDPVLKSKVALLKRDMFVLSRGLMESDFFESISSANAIYDRVSLMKRIMTTDRKTMAVSDPLFASVSDERYQSWQKYYHSMLG